MPAAVAHLVTMIETYDALKDGNEIIFKAEPVKEKRLKEPWAPRGKGKTDQGVSQYAYLGSIFPDVPYYGGIEFAANLFHYNKAGTFAIKLIDYAKGKGVGSDSANRLMAFILGFISHIACDVVCHPYINTIAGAYWNQPITFIDKIKYPFRADVLPFIEAKYAPLHMMTECHQDSWLAKEYFGLKDLSSEGARRSWSGFIDKLSLGVFRPGRKDEVEELFGDVCKCFEEVYGEKLEEDPVWTGSNIVFEMLDGCYDRAIFPFPKEPSENLVNYRHRDHDYYDYLERAFTLSKALCRIALDYYKAPKPGTLEKKELKKYLKDWNLDMGYCVNVYAKKKDDILESIHIRYEHSWCHNYGLYDLKAIPPTTAKYPIIFVPGIMGTSLTKGKSTLWPSTDADDLLALRMNEDGTDATPGIKVGRVIKEATLGINVYLELFEFFNKHYYPEGEWLFEYGYDWRKDLRQSAQGLARRVEEIKRQQKVSKVIILAHSMGGLVARYYAKEHSSDIHILIQLGTPNNGSPKAYAMIRYGILGPIPWVIPWGPSAEDYRTMARNLPGVYHLLPNRTYFDLYRKENRGGFLTDLNGNIRKSPEETYLQPPTALPNKSLVANAMSFFDEIGTTSHCANTHIFVGHGEDTPGRITEDPKDIYDPKISDTSGDETVPMKSVEWLTDVWPKKKTNIHYYKGIEHTKLATDEDVLNHVFKIIQLTQA